MSVYLQIENILGADHLHMTKYIGFENMFY